MDAANRVLETMELVSTIFSFLRGGNGQWKGLVAKLAPVNQPFFHAAVGIVWERMDSFEPFCSLLMPQRLEDQAVIASTAFTEGAWDRFKFYSAKTIALVLNEPTSLSSNPCWAFHMGTSNAGILLPALRILFLNSADSLSLFIAFTVCSHIESLSIDLRPSAVTQESEATILVLTLSLVRKACPLRNIHLGHPPQRQALENILALENIQSLSLTLPITKHDLVTPAFWAPRCVAVWEAFHYTPESIQFYTLNRDAQIQLWMGQYHDDGVLKPRKLIVVGTGRIHKMILDHPCGPAQSQRFATVLLRVFHDPTANAEPLNLTLFAKWLSHSPNLTSFMVFSSKGHLHLSALERSRANPAFRQIDSFLTQLGAAQILTSIEIEGLYFPPGDIILQMLGILPTLPKITTFRFLPVPISNAEVDAFAMPSLTCLKDISQRCSALLHLAIPVDLFSPENILANTVAVGASKMQTLYLSPSPRGLPQYTVQQSARVATYLYLLFPRLAPLAPSYKRGDADWTFWSDIDAIISTLDIVRKEDVVVSDSQ